MKVIRNNHTFEIKSCEKGYGVFTSETIKKGDVILSLSGKSNEEATQTSIQLDDNEHLEDPLGVYLNHCCMPSAIVDRKQRALVAIEDLKPGDEITFDYNTNEDRLVICFVCTCCKALIEGKSKSKTLIYE